MYLSYHRCCSKREADYSSSSPKEKKESSTKTSEEKIRELEDRLETVEDEFNAFKSYMLARSKCTQFYSLHYLIYG